jgi:hypothetical protein
MLLQIKLQEPHFSNPCLKIHLCVYTSVLIDACVFYYRVFFSKTFSNKHQIVEPVIDPDHSIEEYLEPLNTVDIDLSK